MQLFATEQNAKEKRSDLDKRDKLKELENEENYVKKINILYDLKKAERKKLEFIWNSAKIIGRETNEKPTTYFFDRLTSRQISK